MNTTTTTAECNDAHLIDVSITVMQHSARHSDVK